MDTPRPVTEGQRRFGRLTDAYQCTHCGYCLRVCPTYRSENSEAQSPRGRVSIILAFMEGRITPKETGVILSSCLGCRACHRACPAGVRVGKLVLLSRTYARVHKPWPVKLFHWITDRDSLSRPVARTIHWYQQSPWRNTLRAQTWLMHNRLLRHLDTLIPEYHPGIEHTESPSQARGEPLRVALLCGCMGRLFYPTIQTSTTALLNTLGVQLTVLEGFGCCGAPHREGGDRHAFLRQARKVLDAYRPWADKVEIILCDSATCRITVLSYARALADDPRYATLGRQFSEKTVNITDFFSQRLFGQNVSLPHPGSQRIAFFDHCQTRHESVIINGLRKLNVALGAGWMELPASDQCCGAGGDTMLAHRRLSERIRSEKLKAIEMCGTDCIVGTNPGCMLNIEAGLKAVHSPVIVRHLVEILWESWRFGNNKPENVTNAVEGGP
ncbi:MAG: (Fe-S)-binding protein [Magnetococcales bacterium]|nr:(Fe-S)-binding protein [Magnetococcales bacterium]